MFRTISPDVGPGPDSCPAKCHNDRAASGCEAFIIITRAYQIGGDRSAAGVGGAGPAIRGNRNHGNSGKASLEKKSLPRILIVEDEPSTAKVIGLLLQQKLGADCVVAEDVESARRAVGSQRFDLVTVDYQLPGESGLDLLDFIVSLEDAPPAIMVTGHGDERTAVEAFKRGAAGYVVKDTRMSTLLVEEAERAIEFRRAVSDLRDRERQLTLLTENMVDVISWMDPFLRFTYMSPSVKRSFGLKPEEVVGSSVMDFVHPDDAAGIAFQMRDAVMAGRKSVTMRFRARRNRTEYMWLESVARILRDEKGDFDGAILVSRDVTERMEEEELARAQRDLAIELGEMTGTPEITVMALNKMLEVTGLDCGGVYQYSPEKEEFILIYNAGLKPGFIEEVQTVPTTNPASQLLLEGKSLFSDEMPLLLERERNKREGLKYISIVPLRYQGEIVGCVNVGSHTQESLSESKRQAIVGLGAIIGQALGRARLMSALEKSETRYRHLYDFMGEASYTYDPTLKLTAVNQQACAVIGIPAEEMLGKNVLELGILHPDDLEAAAQDIQRLFAGEPVVHDVFRFRTASGDIRVGDVTGTGVWEDGVLTEITNVVVDITEKRRAEEMLSRSEERYRALFEQSPVGVFLYDLNGRITDSNSRNAEMMGTTREGLIGFNLHEARDKRVLPYVLASLKGEVGRYEGEYVSTMSGKVVQASITFSPLFDSEGKVIGGMGMAEDISERLRHEEELLRVNRELLEYAQTTSHDLKGPIVTIQMSAEALVGAIRSGASIESLEEVLQILEQNSSKVFSRIDDLLVLAKAGQAPVDTEDIDVGQVVGEVLSELEPLIEAKNAEVSVAENMGHLKANRTQVFQLFMNLARNAIEHNRGERPRVWIDCLDGGDGVGHRYLVRDNGPGIDTDNRAEIFRPFIKGEGSSGSGIGLSIVDRIVRAYRGDIKTYNNGGACFEFTLYDSQRG